MMISSNQVQLIDNGNLKYMIPTSKNTYLRLAEPSDAEFIISLRTNEKYNKHLSHTGSDITAQKKWLELYKQREYKKEEFYFIIENTDGTPCGTVRIYDIVNNSFCWGSWILNENKKTTTAIESALLIYDFGFNKMHYSRSHFDVRKENEMVISFHKKMNAHLISEDELNFYFEIFPDDIIYIKQKYKKLLQPQ
ncbi:GNAT family N-acetyltransferase [Morganella morganii]